MPADANMDNMYMVTVVATDAKKITATCGTWSSPSRTWMTPGR